MRQHKLGNTGISVSEICLGSMTWGTQNDFSDARTQINMAVEHGVNFVDTAELYPTTPLSEATQGETEAIIGKYMAEQKCRKDLIVATKVGGSGISHLRNGSKITPETISQALDQSLTRLKTDYIDLYQVHSWKTEIPMEETISRLINLSDKGYFKYLGVSNFNSEQIEEMNSHSGDRIISNQPHYSLLFRNSEIDPIPQSHKLGIGSIVYSPIGRGLLTGKYKPGHNFKRNDARFGHTAFSKENFERGYKIYEVLYEWSKDKNYNVSQLVIAWTLYTEGVTSAICGSKNPEQAISNAKAGDISLTQDELSKINDLTNSLSVFEKV